MRKAALAHKSLAELKGVISSIPNENILLETLTLREALVKEGILLKQKIGRDNYFINEALFALLSGE